MRERTLFFAVVLSAVLLVDPGLSQDPGKPSEPARTLDDQANLVNIQFQEDIRVFTVMAALNVAGLDYEKPGQQMSAVRRAVREALQGLDADLVGKMRSFYKDRSGGIRDQDQHIDYISLALLLGEPPEFALSLEEEDLPSGTWRVQGFQEFLQDFYVQAGIESLWQQCRPHYRQELSGYLPVLRQTIRGTLDYFRVPARVMLDRQIILIPDLLNAHDVVNARNLERTYYIVVGPTQDPANNQVQLEHEYLHSLIDPLVEKYGATLLEYEKLLDIAQAQPEIRSDLQNRFLLVVGESLIEALQMRLRNRSEEETRAELVQLFRAGLIFAPFFHRQLADYEKNELVALPSYLDIIFRAFDDSQVKRDQAEIALWEQAMREARQAERQAHQREVETVEAHNRRVRALREVGRLLREKRLDEARAQVDALLQEDPEDPEATFYLAQIHSSQGHHDEAFACFQSVVESARDVRIKAYSLLRLGRISAAKGQMAEARRYFEAVLSLEGDVPDARSEAKDLLAKLP